MTKEQFILGNAFRIKNSHVIYTFKHHEQEPSELGHINACIIIDDLHVYTSECNVNKIGRIGFEAYTYVMGKRISVKHRFEDLILVDVEKEIEEKKRKREGR